MNIDIGGTSEFLTALNYWLPEVLSIFAILAGIMGGFAFAKVLARMIIIALKGTKTSDHEPINLDMDEFYKGLGKMFDVLSSKKKSYGDEMAIYDDVDVEQPQRLPQQTGLSLEELFTEDGEISDKAYMRMN